MKNTRTRQKPPLRPVPFMLWPESVRDLDLLAEASARVHMARSMQPDFRPTILSRARFVSPWSHTVSPGDGNSLDHYSLPGFGFMPRFVTGCLFFLLLMSPGVFAQEIGRASCRERVEAMRAADAKQSKAMLMVMVSGAESWMS